MEDTMPTAEQFVQKCLGEIGDRYEFGAEVQPGTPPSVTKEWDCSELVEVKLREVGIASPDGSKAQEEWCRQNGTICALDEAIRTRGALLFMEGHVGVSLGNGETVEASGSKGVARLSATYNKWTHGGLVPGLTYQGGSYIPSGPGHVDGSEPSGRPPVLRQDDQGTWVKKLQSALQASGFNPGPIDGIFGSLTRSAVEAFQRREGLKITGVVDLGTWKHLSGSV
jgi:hypothetical protein